MHKIQPAKQDISRKLIIYCIFGTEHPWIRKGGEASDKPIDSAVLSRMKQFRAMNKLKKLASKVLGKANISDFVLNSER